MVDHSDDELDYEKLSAQVVEGLIATTEGWNRLLAQARELSKQVAAKYDKAAKNAVATKKYFEDVLANAGEARERFAQQLQEAFRTVQQVYEVLPKRIRESLGTLGKNGWYLDPNLPFSALWKITRQLDEGHFDEINEVLTAHYHENADEILVGLCERFPRRKHLFDAGFSAHKRAEYELSIPLFLAQADGICNELIGTRLYSKKKKNVPMTAAYVGTMILNPYRSAILHPLAIPLPISASNEESAESPDALNRHEIMHGESLDYGTQTNSCRAISLLHYLCTCLGVERTSNENRSDV